MDHKSGSFKDFIILALSVGVMFFLLVNSHYFYLYIYGAILACIVLAPYSYVIYSRWKGVYPKAGDEDINSAVILHKHGYRLLAIRCYRKATKASLNEALMYFRTFDSRKY